MIISDFIAAVREEKEGFSFGKPWRYSKNSLAAVVPILRQSKEKRSYITLSEAKKVKIEDSGSIDTVYVENTGKEPIFVRAGEIFKGKTQERAAVISRFVMPGKTEKITVVCIHASRGISPESDMMSSGFTPNEFQRNFVMNAMGGNMRGNLQHETWNMVSRYSARNLEQHAFNSSVQTMNRVSSGRYRAQSIGDVSVAAMAMGDEGSSVTRSSSSAPDDLRKSVEEYSKTIEQILRSVPKAEHQVGASLLDVDGCKALEVYDLSESWTAIREEVVRKEGEDISKEDKNSAFEFKPEKAKTSTQVPLEEKFKEKDLFKDKSSRIIGIDTKKYVGEIALLNDQVIHLNIFRK